jgi:hypothetical protein
MDAGVSGRRGDSGMRDGVRAWEMAFFLAISDYQLIAKIAFYRFKGKSIHHL